MKFFKHLIVFILLTMLLQQIHAQTENKNDAFVSYIQHSGTDENFTNQHNSGFGEGYGLTWEIGSKGQVREMQGSPFPGVKGGEQTTYRGFIPGIGSYIEVSHKFYLFKSGQLTEISELPCFRQNDDGRSESLKPAVNVPNSNNDYDKIFNRVQIQPCFAGNYAEWKQFLHCCLDQSVLKKDNVTGQKFQVVLLFVVGEDGIPYDIKATDVPSACPDCGDAAIKLLYKHLAKNTANNCDVKVSDKPYKQWLPAIQNGRAVLNEIRIIIPFGYEDDPQNKDIVNNSDRPKIASSETTVAPPINNQPDSNDDEDNLQKANVVEENGKYILTLLTDNSKHIVFRPLPKNMDTAMVNKINTAIGINQGGWGEITKDKNGKQVVTFYSFIAAGSNEIKIDPVPIDFFKTMFYDPK